MKIRFTTPCIYDGEGFGCASFGFAGAPDPAKECSREWTAQHKEIAGTAYYGRIEDVIAQIPAAAGEEPWQAGIVLFGNCGGENAFIRELHAKVGCPLTGGAAACDPVTGKSGLIADGRGEHAAGEATGPGHMANGTGRGATGSGIAAADSGWMTAGFGRGIVDRPQVAVFMISDPGAEVTVESKNIHNNIVSTHKITYTDSRVFDTIDGEDAAEWFIKKRAEYGFSADDFEHMTFSDLNGVNAHTFMSDGRLVSGRDLCPEMILRYVKPGDVYPQMKAFYDDKDAMIFGCAGLKGILEHDIMTDTMGMFMFGEVTTIKEAPEFGNLMLSKLIYKSYL